MKRNTVKDTFLDPESNEYKEIVYHLKHGPKLSVQDIVYITHFAYLDILKTYSHYAKHLDKQ